jgi:hypothetical protein
MAAALAPAPRGTFNSISLEIQRCAKRNTPESEAAHDDGQDDDRADARGRRAGVARRVSFSFSD